MLNKQDQKIIHFINSFSDFILLNLSLKTTEDKFCFRLVVDMLNFFNLHGCL